MLEARRSLLLAGPALAAVGLGLVALWPSEPAAPGRSPVASSRPKLKQQASRDVRVETGRGVYPFNRVVVLAIGINKYPDLSGTGDLRFAEADAEAVATLMREQFGYEAETLLGSEATKLGIEDALGRYARELGKDDALIVFFAGHGQVVERPGFGEAGYLVPADAELDLNDRTAADAWAAQALDMQGLTDFIEEMDARHVLFIADACASGFMTRRGSLERWDLKTFLFDRSRTVLAAATQKQSAREDAKRGHGYFTAALLRELEKDDAASVLDVYLPVLRTVADSTNGGMTPQLASVGEGDGMFVFIPQSIPRDEIEGDLGADVAATASPGEARGLLGVASRARAFAHQATTFEDVVSAVEAFDYRFAADAEDRRREWEERFTRFQRNAQAGDAWAMASLHHCYQKGLGTERDPDRASFWARQAGRAERPAGLGRYLLGRCYDYGIGVPASEEQALRLYRESVDAGSPLGRHALGWALLYGSSRVRDIEEGRELLRQAAAEGVRVAEVSLACHLWEQPQADDDRREAVEILERAAERGDPRAHFELYFVHGDGNPEKRPEDARRHLEAAADAGLSRALLLLGLEHRNNPGSKLGLPKDLGRAYELVDRSARQGEVDALRESGVMLANGEGVPHDAPLARERLEAAVESGDAYAAYIRGIWFLDGLCYPQNYPEALSSFRRAADKGDAGGSFMAASLIAQGKGLEVKPRWEEELPFHSHWHMALHYWSRALELGVEGDDVVEQINRQLTSFGNALLKRRAFHPPPGGDAIPALAYFVSARSIAVAWQQSYPESYAYFCERMGIDPATGTAVDRLAD